MAKFIKACECPRCGNLCKDEGITIDLTAPDMVVSLNNFSQTSFYCEECGIEFGTPDIEDFLEEF